MPSSSCLHDLGDQFLLIPKPYTTEISWQDHQLPKQHKKALCIMWKKSLHSPRRHLSGKSSFSEKDLRHTYIFKFSKMRAFILYYALTFLVRYKFIKTREIHRNLSSLIDKINKA